MRSALIWRVMVLLVLAAPAARAQFQLPAPASSAPNQDGTPSSAPAKLATRLPYQWGIGSESDIVYRTNPDLDKAVRDNSLILAPQVNGYIIYRPTDRVEMTLEMILEREIAAREEHTVILPNGEVQTAPKRGLSLLFDQAAVKYRITPPLELTVGRRNFEDDRHYLYDTSLDVVHARWRRGYATLEASIGRKDAVDGDVLRKVNKTRINNHMFHLDWRGIEDHKQAAYFIIRDDRAEKEGRPQWLGLNATGAPSRSFSYWGDIGWLHGRDELRRKFSAHAVDFGATWRFLKARGFPSVTLGYAAGSGDGDPNDNINNEFRQTGLHSNERRLAGVAKFKVYGETLDPDVSNLEIFSTGVGFIPVQNVTVDVMLHRYRSDKFSDELRGSAVTAQMSQVDTALSDDVGQALDVVIGLRSLFGYRRLGVDVRAGVFRPGRAFVRNVGTDEIPDIRRADTAYAVICKFWWIF